LILWRIRGMCRYVVRQNRPINMRKRSRNASQHTGRIRTWTFIGTCKGWIGGLKPSLALILIPPSVSSGRPSGRRPMFPLPYSFGDDQHPSRLGPGTSAPTAWSAPARRARLSSSGLCFFLLLFFPSANGVCGTVRRRSTVETECRARNPKPATVGWRSPGASAAQPGRGGRPMGWIQSTIPAISLGPSSAF